VLKQLHANICSELHFYHFFSIINNIQSIASGVQNNKQLKLCIWHSEDRASWYILIIRIRKITNLFKHTNIRVAFKSINTLQQLTKPKLASNTQEQDRSGIYKLTCNTCQMLYIGQTSQSLKQRYHEHIRYVRHNEPQSAYPQHILNHKHEYGPINNTMTLLKQSRNFTMITIQTTIYPDISPTQATYFRTTHRWT